MISSMNQQVVMPRQISGSRASARVSKGVALRTRKICVRAQAEEKAGTSSGTVVEPETPVEKVEEGFKMPSMPSVPKMPSLGLTKDSSPKDLVPATRMTKAEKTAQKEASAAYRKEFYEAKRKAEYRTVEERAKELVDAKAAKAAATEAAIKKSQESFASPKANSFQDRNSGAFQLITTTLALIMTGAFIDILYLK